jgi:Mor family transcriptional regulator
MSWKSNIKLADLPDGRLKTVAEKCGLSDAILLLERVPGLQIYVPYYGSRKYNFDYIKNNFNNKNMLSIAVRLGINTQKVKYYSTLKKGYKKNIFSNVHIKIVSKRCGEDVAIRLLKYFSGEYIYIPLMWFSKIREKMIEREFDGGNSSLLALKYHVSERYVKKIIAKIYKNKSSIQMELFDN